MQKADTIVLKTTKLRTKICLQNIIEQYLWKAQNIIGLSNYETY